METRFCIEYVNPRHPLHEDGSINVRYDRVLTLEQAEHDLTLILSFGAKILNLYMGNAVDGKTGEWSPIPMIVDKDDWFTTDWLNPIEKVLAEHDPNFTVLWILEKNGFPIENFLSPQEAATYAASEMADEHKEDAYDVEKLANEIMENFDENNGWHYEDYKCIKLSYS